MATSTTITPWCTNTTTARGCTPCPAAARLLQRLFRMVDRNQRLRLQKAASLAKQLVVWPAGRRSVRIPEDSQGRPRPMHQVEQGTNSSRRFVRASASTTASTCQSTLLAIPAARRGTRARNYVGTDEAVQTGLSPKRYAFDATPPTVMGPTASIRWPCPALRSSCDGTNDPFCVPFFRAHRSSRNEKGGSA